MGSNIGPTGGRLSSATTGPSPRLTPAHSGPRRIRRLPFSVLPSPSFSEKAPLVPYTVNGIGTHYYGKRNRQIRHGACRSCGHVADLASYDTRLWFVVLFIPVIPLGRKRIIDECPRCTRHYSVKADQFAVSSQLAVSEGREKYLSDPTVENALDAHARMIGFHQHTESDAFRNDVLARFPRDAPLRAGLAKHLDLAARYGDAAPLYAEAHRLQPELPEARIGVAFARMNEGKLDEARKLLDFMERPGAGQVYPLGPLEVLASLYQQKNLHKEALEIFRHLLSEFPDAAKLHNVRKMVQVSEKKLGVQSELPPQSGSWFGVFNPWSPAHSSGAKTLAFLALVGVLAAAGLVVNNDYIRRHRTLHIVSGLPVAATVQVDDLPPIQVARRGSVTIPEGLHHVSISGPLTARYEIPVRSGYWERWFRNPAWVINVGGTAGLMHMHYTYSANPTPPREEVLAGRTSASYPDVDYIFVPPPESMQVSNKNQMVVKTGLQLIDEANYVPSTLLHYIGNPDDVLTFLESTLPSRPGDALLFQQYEDRTTKGKVEARAAAYLNTGLARRPVEVHWHRTYQNLMERQGEDRIDELTRLYDGLIAAEPGDSMLLYLRSRFEPDRAKRADLLARARRVDPKNPWPVFAEAYQASVQGDWAAARKGLETALQLGVSEEMTRRLLYLARLGTGDADALVAEGREKLKQQPLDFFALYSVMESLTSVGKSAEALQEFNEWKTRNQAALAGGESMLESLRFIVLYGAGELDELKKAGAGEALNDPNLGSLKFAVALVQEPPEKIAADPALMPPVDKPWAAMELSTAFHLAHDDAQSEKWLRQACDILQNRGVDERIAARILQETTKPDFDVIESLSLDLTQKLVFLCAVAQQFPEIEPRCRELAGKLNIGRVPPYQLVIRVFPSSP